MQSTLKKIKDDHFGFALRCDFSSYLEEGCLKLKISTWPETILQELSSVFNTAIASVPTELSAAVTPPNTKTLDPEQLMPKLAVAEIRSL